MREFNKVHVIALPRCATVSMCDGLGALGIRTAHLGKIYGEPLPEHHDAQRLMRMHEQITAGDFDFDVLKVCDGLADYPACIIDVFEALDQQFPGSLFINVRRDKDPQQWLRSAEKQFVGLQIIKTGNGASEQEKAFMRVMTDFRRMTFGHSSFDAAAFLAAYQRHQQVIQKYFKGREESLLDIPDIGLLKEHGFELLCGFLRCDKAFIQFPCRNDHSAAPQSAFLDALKKGVIESQTGVNPHHP